jgi:hypothetical protein
MCIDGMSTIDRAVYVLIPAPSQWPEFYAWAHDAFGLTDDSWDPAGGQAQGNGNLPYGKMLNAIYLLAYALRDEYIPQWHSRNDYRDAALAANSSYHDGVYARFINSDSGEAHTPDAGDRTDYHCPLFSKGSISDDPANRAAVIVHENWHHWQHKHHYKSHHLTGGAIDPTLEGDWYYRHGSGAFDFGTLATYNLSATPIKFHSPYQIAVEFNADLAEYAFGWVPLSVTQSARWFGNQRLERQFKNRVSYRIGQPRPF